MSPAMSPGTVLGGRYRLEDLLADHDGARFWRATDTVLARSVAVHAVASDDPRAGAVLDAARLSATVTDPHFLRVLDCDDDARLAWVINEWGDGVSLDLILQRGPLPPSRAAWLTREVAEAITAAHAHGLHHGRLNPEAVLVTDAGAVKVIGFVTNRAFEGPSPVHPGYGPLDERETDVVDLAGILYAALVGKWPGIAPSAVPPAPREGRHPLRPRQVRAGVPRTLDAICERVLHKEGTQHTLPIETAFEISAALSDFVGDPTAAAPLDLPSMHAEPTQTIPRAALGKLPEGGDTDATLAASPRPPARPAAAVPAPEPTRQVERPPMEQPPVEQAPFEQPADRPLFAEHDRRLPPGVTPPPPSRPALTGTNPGASTGTGTGSGSSSFWPFEPEDDEGFTGKEGRGWLRLAGLVALVIALLAGMFFAFNLGRDDGKEPSADPTAGGSSAVGANLGIKAASDFDPEGDPPEENSDATGLAIDGQADTGWRTSTYTRAQLGGLKSGVGLLLDLGSEQSVGSVAVTLAGKATKVELYAAPSGAARAPNELADVEQVVGNQSIEGKSVLRPESAVTTRYLVLWLTEVPPVAGGFRGEVLEVAVHS